MRMRIAEACWAVLFAMYWSAPALAGTAPPVPLQLTDTQLDAIAAGVTAASADGTGNAQGSATRTQVSLGAFVASGGLSDGGAMGHVSASATGFAGSDGRASSTLSLSLVLP
jgi:hypothetical protein